LEDREGRAIFGEGRRGKVQISNKKESREISAGVS